MSAMNRLGWLCLLGLACGGCSSYCQTPPRSYLADQATPDLVLGQYHLDSRLQERVLALDPRHVSQQDVRQVLSRCPAPRIVNIHGGTLLVWRQMRSFSRFLEAMGYPQRQIRHPIWGSYSFSCYGSSDKLAGLIAWYYERDGMRPMLIGHSQGGMEAVKVLHQLCGGFGSSKRVYNPMTGRYEDRDWIVDPLTGRKLSVVGNVQVSFASAVGAGGLTRFLPNQWSMAGRLRSIPDSACEFTGFYMNADLLGGDLLGLGSANAYHATGCAKVRTMLLPLGHEHYFVPFTAHLADDARTRQWISQYVADDRPGTITAPAGPATNIVWAAEMWAAVRRHWCLEVQRLVRAQREWRNGPRMAGKAGGGLDVGADVLGGGAGQCAPGPTADPTLAQP